MTNLYNELAKKTKFACLCGNKESRPLCFYIDENLESPVNAIFRVAITCIETEIDD